MSETSTNTYLISTTLAAVIFMILRAIYDHYWGKRRHRALHANTSSIHSTIESVDKIMKETIIPTLSFIKS